MSNFTTNIKYCTGNITREIKEEKKEIKVDKKKVKISTFAGDIAHGKTKCHQKLLELIRQFNKIEGFKVNTQKLQLFNS